MAIRPELCALLGSSVADMTDAPRGRRVRAGDPAGRSRTFQALFEYAPDAMWIFDDAGRYLLVNAAACALHCLPATELRRHLFADFVSPGGAAALHLGWPGTAALTQTHGECRLRRPNGTVRDVEIHVTAHFQPGRHLAVARDVTAAPAPRSGPAPNWRACPRCGRSIRAGPRPVTCASSCNASSTRRSSICTSTRRRS